jgi:hypothetical protein
MQTTADKVLALTNLTLEATTADGKQYRGNCPYRSGSDSKGFTLLVHPCGEKGTFTDHARGETGSLYDLAERLNIPRPEKTDAPTSSKRKYTNLDDYAREHGVEANVYVQAGWEYTSHQGRFCLKYSLKDRNGKTWHRYRFTDGDKPSFISEYGYTPCWYGLDRALTLNPTVLVLCNGAPSVVAAQHHGVPAIAQEGGEKKLSEANLAELQSKWKGRIFIALDCDETGKKAAQDIQAQLPDTTIIDLQLGDGQDLADFCKLYTHDSLSELQHRAQVQPKDEHSVSIQVLADNNQKELEAIRAGKVIPMGLQCKIAELDAEIGGFRPHRLHTILAATGMGKTTLAATMSVALIWQSPGLMVSTETSEDLWYKKMASYMAGIRSDKIVEGTMNHHEAMRYEKVNAQLRASQSQVYKGMSPEIKDVEEWVKRWQDKTHATWLMIDCISRLEARGKSGIFEVTSEVSKRLQSLARDTGLIIIGTYQVGRTMRERKNKIPTIYDGKGSGEIENNSDVILPLYYHHYYVKRNMVEKDDPLNDTMPEGKALVYVGKHRHRDTSGNMIYMQFRGGVGFYDWPKAEVIPTQATMPIPSAERIVF